MSHPLFGPEVRLMLQDNNSAMMRTFCETLHPATIAESLTDEDFTPEQVWRVLEQTSIRDQAAVFEYFPIEWQIRLAEGAGRPHMAKLIEKMSHDDRADLLRRLPARAVEGLLRLVDEADRRDIATLVNFREGSVGALMTTDYAWLPPQLTAVEAIDRLRQQAPDRETIYYIYVLDEKSRRLLGVVSLRDLILAQRHALIRDLMTDDIVALKVDDNREKAAEVLRHYDLLAVPVVDEESRLVGIVTHDDAIDVVVQEATEDLQRQGAVGPIGESYIRASFVTVWRKRAFWLAFLFLAEMLTFNAMEAFEDAMKAVFVLGMFIPLINSTGGNSGSQAATLITRSMALGEITPRDFWRVVRNELLMGLALGATLGAIGLGRAWLTPTHLLEPPVSATLVTHWDLMQVIALAVGAVCLWGTLVGALLPMGFKRLGIDPGTASSPFVATFVDVTGIAIYLGIAKMYLL
jgi:magnesium transporter